MMVQKTVVIKIHQEYRLKSSDADRLYTFRTCLYGRRRVLHGESAVVELQMLLQEKAMNIQEESVGVHKTNERACVIVAIGYQEVRGAKVTGGPRGYRED